MSQGASFNVSTTRDDGTVTTSVHGDVDPSTASQLEGELLAAFFGAADADRLVIDLSGVSFMDSSGLRVLIGAARSCRERDAALVVRNPSPVVGRLLEITQLSGELTIETT